MIHKAIIYMRKFVSVALGFSIPVSTALNSIFLILTIPLWFLDSNYKNKISIIKDNKYIWAIFILIGLYFIGLFYGEASTKEALNEFAGMASLLLIPIMIPFFRDEKLRNAALNLFLLTMTITLFLSYLMWFDLLPKHEIFKGTKNDATVFFHHITQNLLMAFSSFLFAVRVRQSASWEKKLLYIGLTILAVFNVTIMVGGKTGYVVLIALTFYFFLSWLRWKGFFVALFVIVILGILTYIIPSSSMHQGVKQFFVDVTKINIKDQNSQEITETSTVQRMIFYKNTTKIISEHSILGVGTGGYPKAYSRLVTDAKMLSTTNPHNEYLMVTSQLGIIGLCAFLYLFLMQWNSASGLFSTFDKIIARGLVLTILSASMVTSTMMDFTERTFYIWMSALLFGGYTSFKSSEGHNEIISNNNSEK
ncbi:MAG: O-antigen ligase family protein [Deltaproteobacteria bacterium]|nr:O-antigen ligase family protein [Deltaproteobacteria bacterium]